MWKILFPIALLFLGVSGYNLVLSKAENDALQQYCGTGMKIPSKYNRKVTNGLDTKFEDAPWTARVGMKEYVNRDRQGNYSTGVLISPRHVLTVWNNFRFYKHDDGTYRMQYPDQTMINDRCEGTDYNMDTEFTTPMRVYFDLEGATYLHTVRKAVILEGCKDIKNENRPMLVELAEPLQHERFKPICMDNSQKTWRHAKWLKFFGWGDYTIKGQDKKFLAARLKNAACDSIETDVVCASTDMHVAMNWGDYGGSAITKIGDQLTLAGIYIDQRFERNGAPKDPSQSHTSYKFAHIANYADKICEISGICRKSKTSKATTTTENGTNTHDIESDDRNLHINIFARS